MKKTFSIFLLALFLVNTLGLYGVFVGLQFHAAEISNHNLDNDRYTESDVRTFQIPVSLPYAIDDEDYKRVTGDFEHDGEIYRLLKQKFSQGTLFVVCVKDVAGKVAKEATANYVKTFADQTSSSKNQTSKVQLPSFSKDFMTVGVALVSENPGWSGDVMHTDILSKDCLSSYIARIKYPPRAFSRA